MTQIVIEIYHPYSVAVQCDGDWDCYNCLTEAAEVAKGYMMEHPDASIEIVNSFATNEWQQRKWRRRLAREEVIS